MAENPVIMQSINRNNKTVVKFVALTDKQPDKSDERLYMMAKVMIICQQ